MAGRALLLHFFEEKTNEIYIDCFSFNNCWVSKRFRCSNNYCREVSMKCIILSLFLLGGCAIPSYTVGNVKVFDRQVDTHMTQEQAREIIDYTFSIPAWEDILVGPMAIYKDSIDQTDGFYYQFFQTIFDGWHFVFTSNWRGVPFEDGRVALVDGVTVIKDKVIFLKVHKCHGHSAIIHEVGHVIRQHFGLPEDREHKDFEFWMVIKWLEDKMIKDLCPADYEPDKLPKQIEIVR
jgi:hypothetical protein